MFGVKKSEGKVIKSGFINVRFLLVGILIDMMIWE